MIWYLLYPFRGTTEPPILSLNHPIRRAFYYHGKNVTRHWLWFILLSVAIAVSVCFPLFFIWLDSSSGFYQLPHHEWMSAKPFSGNQSISADVVIRQIWIHGSYMRALEPELLTESLNIQNAMLYGLFPDRHSTFQHVTTPTSSSQPQWSNQSYVGCDQENDNRAWAFHSPLMYWNCSKSSMVHDDDLIMTIHEQSTRKSAFNLTLRPSSVFAGKSFINGKLVAADALVLTLFDRSNSTRNTLLWRERLSNLAEVYADRWSFYPEPETMTRSHLYKFQFKPISTGDDLVLIALYVIMLAYVLFYLRKTPRAVKSMWGIIATVTIEMVVSVNASFIICAGLRIDLAPIPQEVYPLIVLGIGPDNMFRLMNAVLAYPPQMSSTSRIANALGDVGHLSLAATGQNLAIVWLLHKVVSPGVQAFCTFAAAALIFDFCFHLIFFVAVLSVDVRRVELQDSIGRVEKQTANKRSTKSRQYWLDALLSGRLPVSSRIAFPAVSICFILGLNIQFSESESLVRLALNALMVLRGQFKQALPESEPAFAPPINQARTPQTWLRLQNHQTAEEVIKFVKPSAHTIVARVYDPLAIVLNGSDRGRDTSAFHSSSILWETMRSRFYSYGLVLGFCIGTVVLLMQYLLWSEYLEVDQPVLPAKNALTIKRLTQYHQLDVFRLAVSGKGHMLAADFGKQTIIYIFNSTSQSWHISALPTTTLPINFWPNSSLAMDHIGHYAALANSDGWIAIWEIHLKRFISFTQHENWQGRPLLFELVASESLSTPKTNLITVTPEGLLTVHNVTDKSATLRLTAEDTPLLHASLIETAHESYICIITHSHNILLVALSSESLDTLPLFALDSRLSSDQFGQARWLTSAPALFLVAIVRRDYVDLVDLRTRLLVYREALSFVAPRSVRLIHSNIRSCQTCQSVAVHSFSIAYTNAVTKTFKMKTFTAASEDYGSMICFRPTTNSDSSSCRGLPAATVTEHQVEKPGQWESTNDQAIIGIKHPLFSNLDKDAIKSESYTSIISSASSSSAITQPSSSLILRPRHSANTSMPSTPPRRPRSFSSSPSSSANSSPSWEVWTLSASGDFDNLPLSASDADLFVHKAGPLARLGKKSLAIVLGNALRVVTVGGERVDEYVGSNALEASLGRVVDGRKRRKAH